jgi:hypothetical protein
MLGTRNKNLKKLLFGFRSSKTYKHTETTPWTPPAMLDPERASRVKAPGPLKTPSSGQFRVGGCASA